MPPHCRHTIYSGGARFSLPPPRFFLTFSGSGYLDGQRHFHHWLGDAGGGVSNRYHASKTSCGDAVPVPFFMMVMPATRLPNLAASRGSPVTRRAMAAPALKLSPAPQMSTGLATAFAGTHCSPPSSTTSAPFPPCVTTRQGACM